MVALAVASPWKDPKTGIYKLRRRVPKRYFSVAGDRLIKFSLQTKDPAEARRKWPLALEWWSRQEAEWENALSVVELDEDAVRRIVDQWHDWAGYSGQAIQDDFSPGLLKVGDPITGNFSRPPEPLIQRHVEQALRLAGLSVTDASRRALEAAIAKGILGEAFAISQHQPAAVAVAKQAGRGTLPFRLPEEVLTLDQLFEDWKAVAAVKPRTAAEIGYTIQGLAAFLGHKDARKIKREDLLAWRAAIKADGLSNNTWNHRLSHIRRVFSVAVDAARVAENPADSQLGLKKAKPASWLPYSDEEAVKILAASRLERRTSLRWAHWVMAFSGMRVAEVLQLTAGDIRRDRDTGIMFIAINEDMAGKSVKTSQSRNVPIHPALIDEGFLKLTENLDADEPLFPDKKADIHGNRGGRSWQVTGRWVRETVGITDPRKAPDHSWRHRMEDELRAVEAPEDVRDALLGHARRTMGRTYGVRGEALRRLHAALSKVPNPMADGSRSLAALQSDAS